MCTGVSEEERKSSVGKVDVLLSITAGKEAKLKNKYEILRNENNKPFFSLIHALGRGDNFLCEEIISELLLAT